MKFIFFLLLSHLSIAGCLSPDSEAGKLVWFSTEADWKWCDGSSWKSSQVTALGNCPLNLKSKITYEGGDLKFCNGSQWVSMKGSIKDSCLNREEGMYKYFSSTKMMKYCDGTSWYEMTFSVVPFNSPVNLGHIYGFGGCAGAGWANLKLTATGTSVKISATTLCADYVPNRNAGGWTSPCQNSQIKQSGVDINDAYVGIGFSYGRDQTHVKLDSLTGDLVARCKSGRPWVVYSVNPLCSGKGSFTPDGCQM